jgi:dihydropyrimidine dehydrogenase (NAD+) subunit PreA
VPVIVKLTPNISDITESARAAKRGGADAISLINTVQSIVGVDIDRFIPYPIVDGKSSNGGYCGPAVKPIALNMVKNCALDPDVQIPISGIGGIETWRDTVEFILLGSTSVQVATSAMHYGFGIVREMKAGLEDYMISHNFNSISEFVGKALPNVSNWEGLNLKYQVRATIDPEKCIGCQLCYAACEDGAHQAIKLSDDKNDRTPQIIDDNCVGCNLCSLVCPVESCIVMKRVDEGNAFENWKERMDKDNVPTTFNDDRAGGEGHHVPTVHEAWEKRKN